VAHPEAVVGELRKQASTIEGLRVIEGKKILELTDSSMSKGLALKELRDTLDVDRALFMGDDVTDETAFAVLEDGDVGVHVGVGPTAAQLKVSSPSQLADFLETLVEARRARPSSPTGRVDNRDT